MHRYFLLPVCISMILLVTINVNAQLTVDSDLGTLSLGTMNITGSTATGSNQVDYYNRLVPTLNYGNENIYQFNVAETVLFNVSSVAITGDPDFLLLDGLAISTDAAGKTFAEDTINAYFLDAGPPETGAPILLPPGTYYLAAASFIGVDGALTPGEGTYEIQISLDAPAPPPSATSLGNIADAEVAFTIDTFGSTHTDPELAVWTEGGILILVNDAVDAAGGNFQAELDLFLGLPAGTYFLAVSGFDTVHGDSFTATSMSAEANTYTLNYNGQTTNGALTAGVVDFFSFEVGGSGGLLGDINLDGSVDFFDIQPFIDLLSNQMFQFEGDIDGSGAVDFFDIQPFIDILAGR